MDNPLLSALQSLGIIKKPQIISPLPQSQSPGGYNDPTQSGLNYYYQREAFNDRMAQSPQNQLIKPQQQVLAAQTQQPQGFDINSIGQALQTLTTAKPQLPQSQAQDNSGNFLDKVDSLASKFGLPPGVAQGVWAMEGRGKTINPNNPYNIGAYDTNPQNANAYNFKNPLEGAQEAIKFLAGKSQYQTDQVRSIFQNALAQYKKDHNTAAYMSKIAPVYSTKSDYAQTVMDTPEYRQYSKKN